MENDIKSIIRNFLDDEGRIRTFPAKRKMKIYCLIYLAGKFEKDRIYTEREINGIINLSSTIDDACTLRRELIDYSFLTRDDHGYEYRLSPVQPTLSSLGLEGEVQEGNAVTDCILTRKSIRAFNSRQISKDKLELIAKCAVHAPSGMNRQTWHFTVLQNKELMTKLAHCIADKLGRDYGYCFYSPNALIIASNDKDNKFGAYDSACALQNIFLAAHSLGIGSVWINQLNGICDDINVRTVLSELGIPENYVVYGMAALGYPQEDSNEVTIKNMSVINHII